MGMVPHLWVVNTHLDHAEEVNRARQTSAVCDWLDELKSSANCVAIIFCGDLNAPPNEEAHSKLAAHGFFSAHAAAHGEEPQFTWPSGLKAPLMDVGEPYCADYVYIWQSPGHSVQVQSCNLVGTTPHPEDATLYPSDHVAVMVNLKVVVDG